MINTFSFSQLKIGLKGYPCFAAKSGGDSNVCSIFLLSQTLYSVGNTVVVGWAQPTAKHPPSCLLNSLSHKTGQKNEQKQEDSCI